MYRYLLEGLIQSNHYYKTKISTCVLMLCFYLLIFGKQTDIQVYIFRSLKIHPSISPLTNLIIIYLCGGGGSCCQVIF